jgi:copper/silver efflux system protein
MLVSSHSYNQSRGHNFRGEGRMNNTRDLHDAVIEGAVGRVRSKIMTVCAIFFGLLPISL